MTPTESLSEASWKGDTGAVARLLADGVDPNAAAGDRMPPLHLAIEQQQVEVVKQLIASGADVNRALPGGWSPLIHAIDIESDAAWQEGRSSAAAATALTEVLLRAGAIPERGAFEIAERYGNVNALRLLEQFRVPA